MNMTRLERFLEKLRAEELDGFLVTGEKNIYYLTGFWGSAGTVFISQQRRIFVTDSRYILIAKQVIADFEVVDSRDALGEIARLIADEQLATIGFDNQVSYAYYQALANRFEGYELKPVYGFVEELRQIKDASELAIIRQACQISDQAFLDALDFIKPGKTEREVANFLDFRMRELGTTGVSFETIVASGYRSAMPHGVASDKVITQHESLTLDFGCVFEHYVSDMTRTIHIGQTTDEERAIYEVALQANAALIERAQAGLSFADYDGVPRGIIADAGYGERFTHGIGHGMGLDVHEEPFFGRGAGHLQAGMVVTDEPGIYLDGRYGVRIEDDLYITETGCEVLTKAPKELIVL
ncbi:M24 family metallopeptidase [Streptococcus sp. E24BD]|uniref:M24 family metallopeptidase n=1 Tax=Streptococcus sp. E24BD TaxID=3278715 RepID=UPI00359E439E